MVSRSSSPAPFGGMPRTQAHTPATMSKIKAMYKSGETFVDYRSPSLLSSDDSLSDTSILQHIGSRKRHYSATLNGSTPTSLPQRRHVSTKVGKESRPIAGVASKRSVSERLPGSSSPSLPPNRLLKEAHLLENNYQASKSFCARRRHVPIRPCPKQDIGSKNNGAVEIEPAISDNEDACGPPTKRRKGMTSFLVDSALTAAVFTGAAAVTAVSLWSKWRQSDDLDHGKENIETPSSVQTTSPPPYYLDHHGRNTPIARSALRLHDSNSFSTPTLRHQEAIDSDKNTLGLYATQLSPAQSPFTSRYDGSIHISEMDFSDRAKGGEYDDEALTRMQKQMEQLITEGTRALHSTPVLKESEIQRQILSDTSFSTPSRMPMDRAMTTYDFLRHH